MLNELTRLTSRELQEQLAALEKDYKERRRTLRAFARALEAEEESRGVRSDVDKDKDA